MQRHAAVLRQRRHRKSAAKHRPDGRKVVVPGGVGDLMQSLLRRTRHELRIVREEGFRRAHCRRTKAHRAIDRADPRP